MALAIALGTTISCNKKEETTKTATEHEGHNHKVGEEHKVARNYIYEEKNTFLTGKRIDKSGIRGADGRMSYIPNMHELINIITGWIATNGSMIDLYTKLRDKNIEMGYGKPELEK